MPHVVLGMLQSGSPLRISDRSRTIVGRASKILETISLLSMLFSSIVCYKWILSFVLYLELSFFWGHRYSSDDADKSFIMQVDAEIRIRVIYSL